MAVAEKLTQIAENMPKVYEAGVKAEWNKLWDDIQLLGTRTAYNNSVTTYNTAVKVFPSNIVASMFKFTTADLFEVSNEARCFLSNTLSWVMVLVNDFAI